MADQQKQFDTKFNYQKAFMSGKTTQAIPVSSGGPPVPATLIPITHNLNKITSFRAWYDPGLGVKIPVSGKLTFPIESNLINMDAYMTSTQLVFSIFNFNIDTINVTLYYKVYYDAN